jgi:predicted amidophosphoribosyltransferase
LFTELTRLKLLIVGVSEDILNSNNWSKVTSLVQCAFVVPQSSYDCWKARLHPDGLVMAAQPGWPAPRASIRKILDLTNLQPHEVAYLTDNRSELRAIANSRVGALLWGEVPSDGTLPDVLVSDMDDLAYVTSEYLGNRAVGYYGEVGATVDSRLRISGKRGEIVLNPLEVDETRELQVVILGRYFPISDARHYMHQYTARILRTKNKTDPILAQTLAGLLTHLNKQDRIDCVTIVAPKPSRQQNNGLGSTVAKACMKAGLQYCDSLLTCPEDFPSQRGLSLNQRCENVRGKFRVSRCGRIGRVVIVDDIMTTGSTLRECCTVLLNGGVDRVSPVVFGRTQEVIPAETGKRLMCPENGCDGEMRVRLRKDDSAPFWGCSNFPSCRRTMKWEDGLEAASRLNGREDLLVFPDVAF